MADENTIIEGTVKFRDGKKWKSRWCVMRKLSPVADCVQLQLYRSARVLGGGGGGGGGEGARGACCAALSLQQFVAAESGFTLDKHSNTLALVCQDLVAVLAFETRERLIQWQVKVTAVLGASRSHVVVSRSGSLAAGPARLHVRRAAAALTAGVPPRLLRHWPLRHLRRYGVVDGRFCLEGGSLCGKGEGLHVFVADRPEDIALDFERAADDCPSPRRRPQTLRRTETGNASTLGAWGAARPEGGAEDALSLREGAVGRTALERCMSCMSKLGAMSRSSTAALTPGAKHFSPAWTMEALDEPPRTPLPRACSCGGLADVDGRSYDDYDVPRVPSTEVEGEYYDTPKRLRERLDGEVFGITRSATADALIVKKACGCLLRLGRRRGPRVLDATEDARPPCACRRVTDWANSWMRLPSCRRSATSADLSAADKENMTPAAALYATVDFSRKTRRRTCSGRTDLEAPPLPHYENLDFALSLEHYENAKDMLWRAGATRAEIDTIALAGRRPARAPRGDDEYLLMRPTVAADACCALSGYTPMSPLSGIPPPSPRRAGRPSDEKSASNPSLAAPNEVRRRARPRSSSADSSRFLDDVKEFDGGGSTSSLETLRGAALGRETSCGKSPQCDGAAAASGAAARDSSSSADSGVSCSEPARRRPRSSDPPPTAVAPRVARPPKSSSAEAEVPLLRSLRGAVDSRSTSSGASDMSDYVETLSLCSSHSSTDTPVTMRAGVASSLRPRSGREYARAAACAALRSADDPH